MDLPLLQTLLVAILSAVLGAAELVSRYKDEPGELIRVPAAYTYLVLNAIIGVMALYFIHVIGFEGLELPNRAAAEPAALVAETDATEEDEAPVDDETSDYSKIYLYQIIAAGLGGAAFFRTSIAKTKVGDQDIGVGPSFVIDTFLAATDRAIDRNRAQTRAEQIPNLMRDIAPIEAAGDLTAFCAGTMQNLSANDEKLLKEATAALLSADKMSDAMKSNLIGFNLVTFVGLGVLDAGCKEMALQKKKTEEDNAALGALAPGAAISPVGLEERTRKLSARLSQMRGKSEE